MGCAVSAESVDSQKRDREINEIIEKSKEQRKREAKVLLLGAGEAGKTTVLKQMVGLFYSNVAVCRFCVPGVCLILSDGTLKKILTCQHHHD